MRYSCALHINQRIQKEVSMMGKVKQRKLANLSLLLLLATLLAACVPITKEGARATESADAAAIRAARTAQTAALAAQDPDLVASFWTEDITIRRALGQTVDGREAARAIIEPTGDPSTRIIFQRRATDIEVSSNWPLAYEEGTWTGHVGSATGPVVIRGRYGAQWVKREGEWLIRSEVFVALHCAEAGCSFQALP